MREGVKNVVLYKLTSKEKQGQEFAGCVDMKEN